MEQSEPLTITCAHSPDADDAFMFYALATGKIRSSKLRFRHVLADIQTLNMEALAGTYELTAISYHAYPLIADKYALLASGSSVGDGYGPLVVSAYRLTAKDLKKLQVAIPGKLTTAYLVLKLFEPDVETLELPFDQILPKVSRREIPAGVVIHEGQLTYNQAGLYRIVDLGAWWKEKVGLPLPLGANAIRRDLGKELIQECSQLMKASIQYALSNRTEALQYALQFARGLDQSLADQFIGMYVNHYTVTADERVQQAAQKLLDLGYQAGLIQARVQLEFF